LAISPFIGDAIDFYEFTTGNSFFDGKELDDVSRLLAGASTILGSRRLYEGVDKVANQIIKDLSLPNKLTERLRSAERVAQAIKDLGWHGSKEAIEDLKTLIPELKRSGKLPSRYLTKEDAFASGWNPKTKVLSESAPGKQIGGNTFRNDKSKLPTDQTYHEADIGYRQGYRGKERIVYTENGEHIYLTNDHYTNFVELK
jgi:hypothetical protein